MRLLKLFLLLICSLMPPFATVAFSQTTNLDELANHLGSAMQRSGLHSGVVSDFAGQNDRVTLQGVHLADTLWFALLAQKQDFKPLNRGLLHAQLYNSQTSLRDPREKIELQAARSLGVDVLITGSIEEQPKNLVLRITALQVSTGQSLEQQTVIVPRTHTLDSLAAQPVQPRGPIYLTQQNGVGTPSCLYCPAPRYTAEGRRLKLEGKVVVTAIIDAAGRPTKIWEVRGLGDGLTEQALETVRQWRFKPAQDAKGKAVAVMVPLDVAFRL